ncbi:MAG: glycosyltransferase [Bifidobacteriaceae bacterium]|jgi:UDP-N-acetylglucosamine:LPS N-acetylglucosamine transferase|nr:glycosyltransferase [Bifidobacteriaceae bacterium]
MKNLVLAGGGTAGHVKPMLALAERLQSERLPSERLTLGKLQSASKIRVHFIGTREGLEAQLVPAAGYPLHVIPKTPLVRHPSKSWFTLPFQVGEAIQICQATFEKLQPAAVIGFGGYVALPAYFAAKRLGIPIIIHEQNAIPGLANKAAKKWAKRVCVTFPNTKLRDDQILTGLPFTSAFQSAIASVTYPPHSITNATTTDVETSSAATATSTTDTLVNTTSTDTEYTAATAIASTSTTTAITNIAINTATTAISATDTLANTASTKTATIAATNTDTAGTSTAINTKADNTYNKTILVSGGSLGAQSINQVVAAAAQTMPDQIRIIHITGRGKSAAVLESVPRALIERQQYQVLEFTDDMLSLYQSADLVIARAGAGMVSEITGLGIPTLFVPLGHGNGEQLYNAQTAVNAGGAWLVKDADFTPEYVAQRIFPLLNDTKQLIEMSHALKKIAIADGTDRLWQIVKDITAGTSPALVETDQSAGSKQNITTSQSLQASNTGDLQ